MSRLFTRCCAVLLPAVVLVGGLAAPALAKRPVASAPITITAAPQYNPTSAQSATFSWTSAQPETFTCFLDGVKSVCGTTAATSGTKTYAGPIAAGDHTFTVQGKQPPAGGTRYRAATTSFPWTIDLTPPQPPKVTLQQQSPTKDTTVNLNISDDDGTAASFTCAIDDSSPADAQPCVSGQAFPGLKETPNPHVAYVYAFDSTLPTPNRSTAGTVSFVVDTTAPGSPSFTSQPPVQTNSTSASFTWTDDPTAVSSSCSLDGAVLAPCGATALPKAFSVSNLAQDGHSLLVVDKDAAGNTGSALWTWNVDLTPPPAPSIMTGPANPTDQTSATFTFQDEDATATFLCSVDGGSYSACISPYNVPSVADGAAHSFLVKAKDLAGNIGPASAPYQWTVDSSDSGPVQLSPVSFLTGPHAYSNVDLPTFTWLGLDDTTTGFLCALDTNVFTSCGTPDANGDGTFTVPNGTTLSEGTHVFAVKATDGTNLSPATPYTWTFDKTPPPAPVFSSKPADPTNATTAIFSFASEPSASFTCSLDNAPATMCATPVSLSGLAANDHTFMVHAFDAAGNTSQTSYGWTIDPTVPSAPSVSGPTGYANSSSAHFVWSDSDPVTFSCSLDGAPAATCSSPTDLSGLGDGTHSFAVSAINGSKSSTVSDTWIVDTTAPVLHVTAVPTDGASTNSNAVSPQVTQTEANPGTVSCSLTGPTPSPTCGPYIGIADGSYVLTINTTDLAGNAAAPLVTHWTVDTVAPPAPVVPTPTGPNPTITFTGGEPGDTFLCSVDGGAFVACTSPWTPPAGLSDGSHTLVVASVDAAGNKTASAPISFIVKTASAATGDTTAPTATITVPATLTGSAVVTFNEPVHGLAAKGVVYGVTGSTTVLPANVVCLNGGTPAACAGTFTAVRMTPKSVLVPGQRYTVAAQAGATHDAAGNASVAASKAFRGATSVEEDNVAVHAAWPTVKAKSALGGSYVREHLRGATASWSFAGASITWWTRSGADQGNAAVYIDGVKKATFNNYAATAHARVARTVKGLKKGAHTIRIQVLGTKSAKSRGTFVAVDGFTVGKVVTKTPALTMVLRRLAGSHYLASHAAVADVAGEAVTMTFRGTAITWSTVRGSNQGKAAIYVDGVLKATFDNYANKTGYGVKRTVSHLADKVHTVKVVVLGKHHKGAKGNLVTVDRFTIA